MSGSTTDDISSLRATLTSESRLLMTVPGLPTYSVKGQSRFKLWEGLLTRSERVDLEKLISCTRWIVAVF